MVGKVLETFLLSKYFKILLVPLLSDDSLVSVKNRAKLTIKVKFAHSAKNHGPYYPSVFSPISAQMFGSILLLLKLANVCIVGKDPHWRLVSQPNVQLYTLCTHVQCTCLK